MGVMDDEGKIELVSARVSGEWSKRVSMFVQVEGHRRRRRRRGGRDRRGGWGTSGRKVVVRL